MVDCWSKKSSCEAVLEGMVKGGVSSPETSIMSSSSTSSQRPRSDSFPQISQKISLPQRVQKSGTELTVGSFATS